MNKEITKKENASNNFYGWVEITNKCNLRCPYCYADSKNSSKEELSLASIRKLLLDFKTIGTNTVMISGGEPSIHKHLSKVFDYANSIGLKLVLISNGTLLTESLIKKMAKYNIPVQLSVDSVNRQVYKASRGLDMLPTLLKSVELLRKYNVEIYLAATLTNTTKHTLNELIDFALENEIQNIHIGELVPAGRCTDNENLNLKSIYPIYKELYKLQKQHFLFFSIDMIEYFVYPIVFNEKRYHYCNGIAASALEVSPKGEVSFCMNIQDPAFGRKYNINETSVIGIKKSLDAEKNKGIPIDSVEECKDCEYRYICCGGCRAIAYHTSGKNIHAKSPYCKDMKRFIDFIKKDILSGNAKDYVDFIKKQLPERKNLITKFF